MSRIIEVIVSPKGDAVVQTKGYSGSSCQDASRFLERALGVTSADKKTPEFFQASQTEQEVAQ